ncbi:MAG: hypothetical protein AB1489_21755 [Acidobacteriota bacterium]
MFMLVIHTLIGVAAILIGFIVLRARKFSNTHTRLGEIYHWLMLVICVTALAISYTRGRANIFTYLAPPSYAAALLGYLMAKYRPANWLRWHISGQAGSYIALLTAVLFQFVPRFWHTDTKILGLSLAFWVTLIAPGIIGGFFIRRTQKRWAKANANTRLNKRRIAIDTSTVI